MARALAREPDIQVVGKARDPFVARDLILSRAPDVVLLDPILKRMDGLTFTRRLMKYHPIPILIVSSATPPGSDLAREALRAGAVKVLHKADNADWCRELLEPLAAAVRAAVGVRPGTTAGVGSESPRRSDSQVSVAMPVIREPARRRRRRVQRKELLH